MTPPPPWLAEFHRRWQAARGRRTTASARAFGVGWSDLLEGAGIRTAEDQQTAQREAEALEKEGRLVLKRHRFRRYLILRVTLPLPSATWLREKFGSVDPVILKNQAFDVILRAAVAHPRWPVEWKTLCLELYQAFGSDRPARPFSWQRPEQLQLLLQTLRQLTSGDWPGVPVRSASVSLGLDSKALERHRRSLEAGLSRMFGNATTLESLGLVTSDSMIRIHGPLVLVFDDGQQVIDALGAPYSLSFADLRRAREVRSTARRLLTVENAKTTFRQLAAADPAGGTLIVASSFPTQALTELLAKLPPELPRFHFGDTDPSGWLILKKIREASPRPVLPFRMKWRPGRTFQPLTPRDDLLLADLLQTPEMADCHGEIAPLVAARERGDFEQESLGPPDLQGWPFFSSAP
jgi:hypothetical protein